MADSIQFGDSPWTTTAASSNLRYAVEMQDVINGSFWVNTGLNLMPPSEPKSAAKPPCHEKMKGKARPWATELEPQWEKATQLGLYSEAKDIGSRMLERDIQELTKGAGYPEVTDSDLESMFQFPRLRGKVRWHNIKAHLKFSPEDVITLRLKKDPITSSSVSIPYGAMLRYEEAKETGFFTDFKVVYPNVVTESELARERARERDPAIVGIFNDAMFLICSWDLPEDIKKAEANVDALLALKLKD